MVFEIASLRDLPDSELDTLALAVATEVSRRAAARAAAQDQRPAGPEQESEDLGPEPDPTPEPTGAAQPWFAVVPVYIATHGRAWHRYRRCRHLASAKKVTELDAAPSDRRACRTCVPLSSHPFTSRGTGWPAPQSAPLGGSEPQPLGNP